MLKPCHCSATGFGTPSQTHRNSSLSDPVSWKELRNSNVIRTRVKESRNKSSNQRQEGKKIKTPTSTTAACPLNAPLPRLPAAGITFCCLLPARPAATFPTRPRRTGEPCSSTLHLIFLQAPASSACPNFRVT